ncbi:MAG: hypothetical protein QM711_09275 [Micropruina sp.]|uniref:hypothetical protein n=1 Tax=Micropruina sp. TaxID=2737536 RepID=UPI0039E23BFD
MKLRTITGASAAAMALVASTALAAPPADAASYTKCYRDAPVTICVTTSGGKSVGFKRMGSYLLPKSKVDTTSTCTVSQTVSTSWSVSVSLSAELKAWIFAKVSATVTGGLVKSTSLTAGVSRTFKQKKGTTYRCEWGYARYQSKVTKRISAGGQSYVTKGKFTGPKEMQLRVVKL